MAYKEVKWPLIFQPLPEDMDHLEDRFYGCLFQDSDFSKWIEAVGYSLTQQADPELEKRLTKPSISYVPHSRTWISGYLLHHQ